MDRMIEGNNKYIIKVVFSDIEYLREEWDQNINDDFLRRSSNVLRNLLVEGKYGQAWRILGLEKQPKIDAPNLEKAIDGLPFDKINFAQAGGAHYKGVKAMAVFSANFALNPEQIKKQAERGPFSVISTFWISDFLQSPCIIIKGEIINRSQLIKYVANKLGGVHIDMKRNLSKEEDVTYAFLDEYNNQVKIADKNAIYYELLSIGQSLVNSGDAAKFINIAKSQIAT